MNVKLKNLFSQKRNLVVTILVCVFLLAILGGIIYASIAYGNGKMGKALFHRKVWYAVLCVLMMAAVFLAQLLFRVRFSVFCEIALISFAFAALAGGTVFTLYSHIPVWDKILHTLSGPLFSIVGLGFAILLSEKQPTEKRRVVMCVVFAFLASLAVGYLWEIFESTVDSVISGYNNQRWLEGLIQSLPDGTYIVSDKRGTALIDTMSDMICNLCGTVAFLVPVLILCLKKPERIHTFKFTPLAKKEHAHAENPSEHD